MWGENGPHGLLCGQSHHAGVMEVNTQGVGSSLATGLLPEPSVVNHLKRHMGTAVLQNLPSKHHNGTLS